MAWFQVSFYSECLSRSVPLNVLIPADNGRLAASAREGNYRTLYLLHGYSGNCTDWLLNGQVNEISRQYQLAVVMPSGNNGDYVDQPKSGILGSTFVSRELVDFTRKLFPLSDRREDTILAGFSMGGYGALYNAMKRYDVFGHAIALSASFMPPIPKGDAERAYFEALHGDVATVTETDRNLKLTAKTLLASGRVLPDLYIACGYNDVFVPKSRDYSAYLTEIGFEHTYEEGPGTHDWSFWNAYLRRGLDHVLPDRPALPPNRFWTDKYAPAEFASAEGVV
jgi:S-formylglutathione hydrolase FrmB